jgi:CBS domain-containing protein
MTPNKGGDMKVQDVMTRDVVTVVPETPLKDVAVILVSRGISGLPVCNAQRHVLGVISEGDILYKERGSGKRHAGPFAWLLDETRDADRRKEQARQAGEAMTSPALTIGPHRSVSEAASLMTQRGINRLPVVAGDELVGIVTRADLVRAFARSDEEIKAEIEEQVLEQTLWIDRDRVEVDVAHGCVMLGGTVEARSDAILLERFVGRVPGVVSVYSLLVWDVDDTTRAAKSTMKKAVR